MTKNPWLVSDAACKGCRYYGRLGGDSGPMACHYTYYTGRLRKNPPAKCEVKRPGRVPRADITIAKPKAAADTAKRLGKAVQVRAKNLK